MHMDSSGHWVPRGEGVLRLGGSGVWNNNLGPWLGRSSGFADGFGVVRKAELDSGVIHHALAVAWPKDHIAAPGTAGAVVPPAVTTDGTCTTTCAPMGSRLQLDPTLTDADLTAMGIPSYYLPLARALQQYGAYIGESSSWMTIYGESWNNDGPVSWPSGWSPASHGLMSHLRIVGPPPAPALDDRTVFGEPHM